MATHKNLAILEDVHWGQMKEFKISANNFGYD